MSHGLCNLQALLEHVSTDEMQLLSLSKIVLLKKIAHQAVVRGPFVQLAKKHQTVSCPGFQTVKLQ